MIASMSFVHFYQNAHLTTRFLFQAKNAIQAVRMEVAGEEEKRIARNVSRHRVGL